MIRNKGYRTFIRLLFILCFLLYNFQGSILPIGSSICMVSVAIVMVMEIVCFLMTISNVQKPIFSSLFVLMLLTFFAYVLSEPTAVTAFGTQASTSSQILAILYICMFVSTGYLFYKKEIIRDKDVNLLLVVLLSQAIISYFYTRNSIMMARGVYAHTNNAGYYFASLLPFVFFITKGKYRLPVILTIVVFVLLCAKRGAIIVSLLFILYYLNCSMRESRKNVSSIFYGVVVLASVAFLVYRIYSTNDYLQSRVEATAEGNSSHREVIYSTLLNAYLDFNNILQYLFGKGLLTSVRASGFLAHNDWIEILLSNGLVGITVYLCFFVQLVLFSKSKSVSMTSKHVVFSILIMWFVKTFVSMAITDVMLAPLPLLLGVVIAKEEIRQSICYC